MPERKTLKMPIIDITATGTKIKELRDRAGLTTKEISGMLGFNSPTAVYKWISGTSLPTIDNLVILADILGVGIEDILVVKKIDVV